MSPSLVADAQEDVREALRSRVLPLILLGAALFGLAVTVIAELQRFPAGAEVLGFVLVAMPIAQWLLLRYRYRLGLWVVALGYPATILLAFRSLNAPIILSLLPATVGTGTLLLGPVQGTGLALLVSFLLLLAGRPFLGPPGGFATGTILAAAWAVHGLAWAALSSISQVVSWWSSSYEQMRTLLEEARAQRVELKQIQQELVQANLELARVTERLQAMRQVAEEARRAKEEFVANVSHELRTPLNMIIGFAEMIAQAPNVYGNNLPSRLLADIDIILSSSRHLASLVDDVLDLSQIDAGRMALSREWTSLREVVEAAVTAVQPLFASKGLTLETDIPDDLPLLFCDRTRVRQVVLNLLSNAGRFTERGGVKLCARREGSLVIVSVADTGPGIPPESQQRLFEPFVQLDGSIRRRYGGSGLGLAISKRFVELHGGKMWLESRVGVGTTFYFSLPVEHEPPQEAASISRWFSPYHEYQPRSVPSRAPKPLLLPRYVVMESGEMLRRLLHRYQGEVEIASVPDVDAAVQEIGRLPARALIVNDLAMFQRLPALPDELASLPYGTPVIFCWLPDRKEAAERLGVVQYLIKPVDRATLLETLAALPRPVRSVLVVDDEPEALQLFGRILQSAGRGYRILRATTGHHALALLRERRPDVMLLDLIMPDVDGYEVLRKKSSDPSIRDIPVVAISAQDPSLGPLGSPFLAAFRAGGLGAREVLGAIEALSEVLAPPDRLDRPTRSRTSGG